MIMNIFKQLFHKHKFEEVGRIDVNYKFDDQHQFVGSVPIHQCSICKRYSIQVSKFTKILKQANK